MWCSCGAATPVTRCEQTLHLFRCKDILQTLVGQVIREITIRIYYERRERYFHCQDTVLGTIYQRRAASVTYSRVSMSLVTGMRSAVSQDGKRRAQALELQRKYQVTVKKPRNARHHIKISPGSNTCLDTVERSVSTKLYCMSSMYFFARQNGTKRI